MANMLWYFDKKINIEKYCYRFLSFITTRSRWWLWLVIITPKVPFHKQQINLFPIARRPTARTPRALPATKTVIAAASRFVVTKIFRWQRVDDNDPRWWRLRRRLIFTKRRWFRSTCSSSFPSQTISCVTWWRTISGSCSVIDINTRRSLPIINFGAKRWSCLAIKSGDRNTHLSHNTFADQKCKQSGDRSRMFWRQMRAVPPKPELCPMRFVTRVRIDRWNSMPIRPDCGVYETAKEEEEEVDDSAAFDSSSHGFGFITGERGRCRMVADDRLPEINRKYTQSNSTYDHSFY